MLRISPRIAVSERFLRRLKPVNLVYAVEDYSVRHTYTSTAALSIQTEVNEDGENGGFMLC